MEEQLPSASLSPPPTALAPSNKSRVFLFAFLATLLMVVFFLLGVILGQKGFLSGILPGQKPPPTLVPDPSPAPDSTADWQAFESEINGYEIKMPSSWQQVEHSSNFYYVEPFQAPDKSQLEIVTNENKFPTLKEYLAERDRVDRTGWEGQPSKEVVSSQEVTVSGYGGIRRTEQWLAAGFTTVVTYLGAGNKIYEFRLLPNGNSNYSQTQAAQNYNEVLSTFKTIE